MALRDWLPPWPRAATNLAADPTPRRGVAAQEFGTSGTENFGGYIRKEDYNPEFDDWQKAVPLYDKMRRTDAQVRAMLQVIKLPLRGATWTCHPASDDPVDKLIADFCNKAIFDDDSLEDSWQFCLRHILLQLEFGVSVLEKVWKVDEEGHYRFKRLAPRLPRTLREWHVDREGKLVALVQYAPVPHGTGGRKTGGHQRVPMYGTTMSYQYLTIPAEQLAVFTLEREGDNYQGNSLLRTIYRNWWFKDEAYRCTAVGLDRWGVGIPVAQLEEGHSLTNADREVLRDVLKSVRANRKGLHGHARACELQHRAEWWRIAGHTGVVRHPVDRASRSADCAQRARELPDDGELAAGEFGVRLATDGDVHLVAERRGRWDFSRHQTAPRSAAVRVQLRHDESADARSGLPRFGTGRSDGVDRHDGEVAGDVDHAAGRRRGGAPEDAGVAEARGQSHAQVEGKDRRRWTARCCARCAGDARYDAARYAAASGDARWRSGDACRARWAGGIANGRSAATNLESGASMRIIGVRADGAQLVAVGGGVSVILKGDQKSKPLDDRKAEKLGPWTPQSDNLADRRSVQKQLDRARMTFKLSEPMPRQTFNLVGPGKHSQKWHDCWEKVQAKGHDESSAAAICTAQLGDESYDASIAEEVPNAMELGGSGSGNWGHAGRPGEIGGSGGGGGASYRQGDQVVVTDGGQKVQAHHSSPTRVTIPSGTQGRYIRPAGDDWHIVDTGHYESARVRGDQLRARAMEGPGAGDAWSREDPQWTPQEERVAKAIEGPGAGGSNAFERGGAHGPKDTHFERGGPAPSTPRAGGGGENLKQPWSEKPALPQYKPNPFAKSDPTLKGQIAEIHDRHSRADKMSAALDAKARAKAKAKKLSVGEMVRIIGNVRGQGQMARVLRIDADTALVDGFGRFNLMDLAAMKPQVQGPAEEQMEPQQTPSQEAAEGESASIVKPIKPSEPIGGKRIKKQKPMLAKPLYTVAAVRKPKIKIVKPIAVAAV